MRTRKQSFREDVAWLKDALTGDAFLDPKSLLLFAMPLSLVTSVLALEPDRWEQALFALGANLLGFVLVGFLVLVFHLFRARTQLTNWVLPITVSAFIGAIKAAVTSLSFAWFSVGQFEFDVIRVLLGATAGLVMLPITAVIVHALHGFERERLELIRKTYQRELDRMTTKSEEIKLQKIRSQLDQLIVGLGDGVDNHRVTPGELNLLRELVDKLVRPLSHSLYESIEKRFPSFAWGPLLKQATNTQPPVLALGLLFIVAAPQTIVQFGPTSGSVLFLSGLVLIPLIMKILFAAAALFKAINTVSFLVLSALSTNLAMALSIALPGESLSENWFYSVTVTLWFVQSAVLFSAVNQARKTARQNRDELLEIRASQPDGDGSGELDFERKEFANQLHGEVQSRMLSLALRTEGDAQLQRDLVVQELQLIRALLTETRDGEGIDLQSELDSISMQWEGIATVRIRLASLHPESDPTLILRIIEQGVSNSVRHGLADRINVEISANPTGGTQVMIVDNGVGPTSGKHGLGFKLIASCTEDWSFRSGTKGGAELIAVL